MNVIKVLNPGCDAWGQFVTVAADQGIRSVLRLGITIVLARMCSRDDFSFYTTLQSVYLYMLFFCTSFIIGPYVVLIHDKTIKNKSRYDRQTALLFVLGAVLLGAVYVGLFRIIFDVEYYSVWFVLSSLCFIGGDLFNLFVRTIFIAVQDYKKPLVSGFCSAVLIGTGLFFLPNPKRIEAILAIGGIGYFLPSLVIRLWGTRRNGTLLEGEGLGDTIRRHFEFGKWVFLNTWLNTLIFTSFPFFLRAFGRDEAVAEYGAYYNFFAIFNPAMMTLMHFFAPKLAKSYQSDRSRFNGQLKNITALTGGVSIILLPVVLTAGTVLFRVLYGDGFTVTWVILGLWAVSKMFEVNSTIHTSALKAKQDTFSVFGASLASLAVFVTAGLPLVKFYGLGGVVVSLLISRLAWIAASSYFLFMREEIRME